MTRSTTLSLFHLLDPAVLGDPYPLYTRLRTEAPVLWDPYLHAWIVTRYRDVATVLTKFSADRTPTPDTLTTLGMPQLTPIAEVMTRQMLFLDPPQHTRIRTLAAAAFTPRRIATLRHHIHTITEHLIHTARAHGEMDLMAELANPLPAIVTAEMLGIPVTDHPLLKTWSTDFAEMLGNFQHNPGRTDHVLRSVQAMTDYFRTAIHRQTTHPTPGLINALTTAEHHGDRLTEDEIIANIIVTMVGGQETTTNLIGNGMLTLLRHPDQLAQLHTTNLDHDLITSAVEELLRFESPSQHTARIAPTDTELAGQPIQRGQAVIAVMGAANRDPERFPEPDRLDLRRTDNRHLAFGWAGHFCFGAPLARMEAHTAFTTLLRTLPNLELADNDIDWRPNLGLRGLQRLRVRWRA